MAFLGCHDGVLVLHENGKQMVRTEATEEEGDVAEEVAGDISSLVDMRDPPQDTTSYIINECCRPGSPSQHSRSPILRVSTEPAWPSSATLASETGWLLDQPEQEQLRGADSDVESESYLSWD